MQYFKRIISSGVLHHIGPPSAAARAATVTNILAALHYEGNVLSFSNKVNVFVINILHVLMLNVTLSLLASKNRSVNPLAFLDLFPQVFHDNSS